MKNFFLTIFLAAVYAFGQPGSPIPSGPIINFVAPALDAKGQTVAFASTVTPEGSIEKVNSLYLGGTKLTGSVTSVGLTSDGSHAVLADVVDGGEGVAMVDTSTGAVKTLTVDTQGCIRPALVCVGCFFACVVTPHATADGGKVLYAARRNQPFYVVNADGTGLEHLPTYSGTLAPSAQRVISASGVVVFASEAPSGPTFAAAATDVFSMQLDGTNLQNLTRFGNSSVVSANAAISADGSTIVFETTYAGKGAAVHEPQIWAVQPDGSQLRQLTFGPDSATNPSISGDGKSIVFLQSGKVWILQPPAAPVAFAAFRYSTPQSPVISDDGLRVAFLLGPANSTGGAVYQVNADGSGLHAAYAPRAIGAGGVVSAAGASLPPSPGGIFTVYGINLADDSITSASRFPLPDLLAGASVLVNGSAVPLLSVSTWQIDAQLPPETPAKSVDFELTFADGSRTPVQTVDVAAAAPDVFLIELEQNSILQAAAFHAGTGIPADDVHPAHAGEVLEMYATGLGTTIPAVPAGQPSPGNPPAQVASPPVVLIGGIQAQVLFAGLTPGLAGVYQLNVVAPNGLRTGRYSVTLQGGGNVAGQGSIAVQ